LKKLALLLLLFPSLLWAAPTGGPGGGGGNALTIQGVPVDPAEAGDDGKYLYYDHSNIKYDYDTPAGGGDMASSVWDGDTDGFIDTDAGGTDIDTSSSTGVPSISSGTWSVSATLPHELGGLEADVHSYAGLVKITGGTTSAVTVTTFAESILDDTDEATFKATVNLEAGTDFYSVTAADLAFQPLDAELTALAGLTSAADKLPYFGGSGSASLADFTAFGRSLLDDADEATFKATVNLEIGTDVQAYDTTLAGIASDADVDGDLLDINAVNTAITARDNLDVIIVNDQSDSWAAKKITVGNFVTGLGGSGGSIIVDLEDDGGNDTTALAEIALVNIPTSMASVGSDKLTIDFAYVAALAENETITGNWVNTTNPWADNEVVDALTISGGTVNNSIIGGSTPAAGTFTTLNANSTFTVATGQNIVLGTQVWNSGDLINAEKVADDADLGDLSVSSGVWSVANDSHAHTSSTITLASTDLTDTATLAYLAGAQTFTANNVFGNADTDTLTVRGLLLGGDRTGSNDAVQIASTLATATYATAVNELYVAGSIESGENLYGVAIYQNGTQVQSQHAYLTDIVSISGPSLGDLMYFDGTDWIAFAPGTNGYFLQSQGDGVALTWASGSSTGVNETYGSGWNADQAAPEKDDIYDYLHTIDTDDDGDADSLQVTANNSTDETVYLVFVDGATGTQGLESDTGLTYNPSTGNLTITGTLTAASYATSAADGYRYFHIPNSVALKLIADNDALTEGALAFDGYNDANLWKVYDATGDDWDNYLISKELIDASSEIAAIVSDETGTGVLVLATSPTLVTPTLGVATATSINKVAITAPATSATLTLSNGSSLITSGGHSITLTSTASTNVTLPTTGTLAVVSGALGEPTVTDINDVTITDPGTGATITLADGSTLTTAGDLTTSGAYALTLTLTGTTNVTVPTSGTLATTASNITGTAAGLTAQYIDWNASSGGSSIANKPSLGAAALVGVTGSDSNAVTGTKGTSGDLAVWNGDGDLVDGPTPPSGTIVGTTDTQTLSAKTIDGDVNTVQDLAYSSIKSTSRSGSDATLITGTKGTSGTLAEWNADGDLVEGSVDYADTTGSYKALTPVSGSTTDFASTFTGANLYGGTYVVTSDAGDLQLPLMVAGMNFTIITSGDIEVVAATNANDGYMLDGVSTAEDNSIVNTSTSGDIAVIQYYTTDDWLITTNGWSTE